MAWVTSLMLPPVVPRGANPAVADQMVRAYEACPVDR